jgi:hypothetical protein
MASPLQRFGKDFVALLPIQYLGTTGYYAAMSAFHTVAIDYAVRYDKRYKTAHRFSIVDTRDELTLTVPVSHDFSGITDRHPTWADVRVSTHGSWWDVHRIALESAYGRTPFFEFYIDRFMTLMRKRTDADCESVVDLIRLGDKQLRRSLDIDTRIIAPDQNLADGYKVIDLRRFDFSQLCNTTYYQLRADRLGFRHGLSALDLLFNVGTEAPLVLRKMTYNASELFQI